jgi:hypothetical protein
MKYCAAGFADQNQLFRVDWFMEGPGRGGEEVKVSDEDIED